MSNCGRCGGTQIASGSLYSAVRVSFRPSEAKFLTFQTGDVMTKAMMCRDCGVVEIVGDVTKLKRLMSGASAAQSSDIPLKPIDAT